MLRSVLLSGVRPFFAAPGGPASVSAYAPAPGTTAPAAGDGDAGGDNGGDAGASDAGGGDGGAPAAASGDGSEGDAGAGGGDGNMGTEGGDGAPKPKPAATAPDWKDKELRRKHAQLQQTKTRMQELEAELETTRQLLERRQPAAADPAAGGGGVPAAGTAPAVAPLAPMPSKADIDAEVAKRFAVENFNKSANDADAAGKDRYKDGWDKATDTLAQLGGFDHDTMVKILATDDPAKVIYTLGSKPEEFQRLMELPEARRQNELVKLGLPDPKPAPKRPSDAAPPVEGVHSRARGDSNALRDDLDDETWYARRAREKKARWDAKQSGRLPA